MAAGSRPARGHSLRQRAAGGGPRSPRARQQRPQRRGGGRPAPPPCRWAPESRPRRRPPLPGSPPGPCVLAWAPARPGCDRGPRGDRAHCDTAGGLCRVPDRGNAASFSPSPRVLSRACTVHPEQGLTQCCWQREQGDDSLSAITFDSDFETKAKKKSFRKPPPPSPKSPYHSKPRKVASWRSLRTATSMPLGNRMSLTPQTLWLGSSKQGGLTPPLKSELSLEHAWTSPPRSTPDYLTEALRRRRSDLRRSASNGHVPGTLVYREKEDMYDEIIELKKSLHMQKSDVDLMRTKLRRLEEENSRKDRQIEQLLDPSRGTDFVRTLAEKRPDTGWVVNGLKQRILKLEQQCKEKDNAINKLQTDIKTTNLEEMRIAMETYYEEIHRLQTLLATSEPTGKKPPVEKKIGLKRQKKMSSALLSLSRSVQELTEENQSLKEDLDRVLSSSPTVSKTKGICPRATQGGRHEERGYMEWSKPRLLRRISELEKKISLMESPKSPASEVVQAGFPADSSSSSTVHRQPRSDRQEEGERLRGAVKSLKGERNALQSQLQEKELEVKQLLQTKADLQKELENMKEGEKERREREEALREEIQTLTKKFQELVELKKEEKDDTPEVTPESQEEPQPSRLASSPAQQDAEPQASGEGSWAPSPGSEGRRDTAARLLQARWKVYRHKKKKSALDEVATVLQAGFRGHLARAKLLSSKACGSESPSVPSLPSQKSPLPCSESPVVEAEGDPGQEEAITVIQSVFRAHLAQARLSAASHRAATAAPPRRRSALAAPREPSSPPCPAASPGQEDSEVSGGETAEGPAAEDEAPRPWGPGEPAAPQPCSAESSPAGLQPMAPPPPDDVHSDDSDEIVMAPSLPTRKSAPPP
ncbi:IQ domain-containing protein E isoform X3 [Equus quagga]|uniref:IQ domain-containing protein E isoform X3 n=1 Tax=Equus quagga TaxID=89248 RepID=UPI001EE253E8|nr:IQ domain-containing protein E isoform X3 [Equus quagga]